MEEKETYLQKMAKQLEQLDAKVAELKAKAAKAKAEVKIEYCKTLETLQGKQDVARTKLKELRSAGDDAWEDVKAGAENVWTEIKAVFQNATSRFK